MGLLGCGDTAAGNVVRFILHDERVRDLHAIDFNVDTTAMMVAMALDRGGCGPSVTTSARTHTGNQLVLCVLKL